jgi:hypothetical protein
VIELEPFPKLTNPVLVAAFEGWNDAADAASSVLDHLMSLWPTTLVAALDPEDYYDFQVNRPIVSFGTAGDRRLTWPTTQIAVARIAANRRDLVLLRGVEPNMRWRQFCRELVGIADDLGVKQIVSLGALLADVPHTRPIPVSATGTDADVAARFELEEPTYEGPPGSSGCSRTPVRHWAYRPCPYGQRSPTMSRRHPVPRQPSRYWGGSRTFLTSRFPWATYLSKPGPGSVEWMSCPVRTPRSRTMSRRSNRREIPPTCRRRAATPSPGSSRDISSDGSPMADMAMPEPCDG